MVVGDALGTTVELSERDALPHHTEMTSGGPFHLRPGEWTDDTPMALALADSLVLQGFFDPEDLRPGSSLGGARAGIPATAPTLTSA